MCGVAGRILTTPGKVGADLVKLMESQRHRGADSTGFALYGEPLETGYIVRAMAFDRERLSADLQNFKDILSDNGSDFVSDPTWDEAKTGHVSVRMIIKDPADFNKWVHQADSICENMEIQSVGRSLEIVKDPGDATEVADRHKIRDFIGTHGLGHARLATESSVSPTASHPFWARPFPDVAIVHNGQITDYYTWRDRLERKGYRFMTYNDSELLAVWVSDQMSQGLSQAQALQKSISSIDGVFTFLISDIGSMGFAKDRWAIKPLVVIEKDGQMAVATEEQAVRTVYHGEEVINNYDGPSQTKTWAIGSLRKAA